MIVSINIKRQNCNTMNVLCNDVHKVILLYLDTKGFINMRINKYFDELICCQYIGRRIIKRYARNISGLCNVHNINLAYDLDLSSGKNCNDTAI